MCDDLRISHIHSNQHKYTPNTAWTPLPFKLRSLEVVPSVPKLLIGVRINDFSRELWQLVNGDNVSEVRDVLNVLPLCHGIASYSIHNSYVMANISRRVSMEITAKVHTRAIAANAYKVRIQSSIQSTYTKYVLFILFQSTVRYRDRSTIQQPSNRTPS